ncbi:hypothetical protein EYF80_035452 [Liparis tanakae]|uniref:Uncharacterized protein n=1 Tax=Liparis tanakae TaxID=230148 RepID=A0A4Z2GNR8_9TELE|nr:hypothetical protein EYF80_035452 [Liparis tanakae]
MSVSVSSVAPRLDQTGSLRHEDVEEDQRRSLALFLHVVSDHMTRVPDNETGPPPRPPPSRPPDV